MLYVVILTVHIAVCLVLIAVILLQAGRGGGLADTFGGTTQSILGTQGASVLTRATTVCAIIFMLTSIGLAILSAGRGRSLMAHVRPKAAAAKSVPIEQKPAAPAPASGQKPASPASEKPAQ